MSENRSRQEGGDGFGLQIMPWSLETFAMADSFIAPIVVLKVREVYAAFIAGCLVVADAQCDHFMPLPVDDEVI
jgi:hypothetical protein